LTATAVVAGRYRIGAQLGSGGMAVVHLAHDTELDRQVALKLLAENLTNDEPFRARFVREARLAARLAHPNVVHVYDAGEDGGRPFIVTEYVPGDTLAQLVADGGRRTPRDAAELGRQAALGLHHAHEAGLVHRDVKPQNLLLREDGVLKVADFGIARAAAMSQLTELGTVLGTAAYLSPEQAAGDDVTAAADVYSLGAVLYELLTGAPPYTFASLAEVAEQQRSGTIVPVRDVEPSVPADLEAVVMQCLARDRRFRPASAAELAAMLDGGTESVARPRSPTAITAPLDAPRTRRVIPRASRTTRLLVAASLLAVIGLVVGLVGFGGGGTPVPSPPRTPPVVPVPVGSTPAASARAFARWLRARSR
jgi:eukaryotic-like serine/threonine-protein kinase